MAERFVEPQEDQRAGLESWTPLTSYYQQYMATEGLPIYQGIGVRDVRELELGDWARLDLRGAFLYLDGLEGIKGIQVLELPGGGQSRPARHLYTEFVLVVEGRGTTETSRRDRNQTMTFEWQPGSLFSLPPNVDYRFINGTSERALFIAVNNSPGIINLFRDEEFVFNNDHYFDRYVSFDDEFYRHDDQIVQVPFSRRAAIRSNFFPDIVGSDLPLDNQRAPGYRRIQPAWRGFEGEHTGFIAEYPQGRYSMAHYHESGAVLVCLKGAGYTYNWQRRYGIRPWEAGHGDKVRLQEYVPGGLVAAAPGGGDWYHQHFGVGRDPLRVINFWGGPVAKPEADHLNPETGKSANLPTHRGGASVDYHDEDPVIRENYERALAKVGLIPQMPSIVYEKGVAAVGL